MREFQVDLDKRLWSTCLCQIECYGGTYHFHISFIFSLYVFKVESDYEIVYKPSGVDNDNEIKEIGKAILFLLVTTFSWTVITIKVLWREKILEVILFDNPFPTHKTSSMDLAFSFDV